jgi:NAD(P)-dependent dehydrogenase (short-subunit alcohol dehydrogenase family)
MEKTISQTDGGEAMPAEADVAACLRVLRRLSEQPGLCDRAGLAEVRRQAALLLSTCKSVRSRESRARDRDLLDSSGIRGPTAAPARLLPFRPTEVRLAQTRPCYVCKQPFSRLHHFYDSLCPDCAELNFAKRSQTTDLTGRVALVTGGRIKIGYQTALKLLRAGASVSITTRFPRDAAGRYVAETDFAEWSDRLQIHALDLRDLSTVDRFGLDLVRRLGRLDVLINNAAQTVRRPPAFYRHLMEQEREPLALPPALARVLADGVATVAAPGLALRADDRTPALHTQLALLPGDEDFAHFPAGWFDRDGQQVDLRDTNSWSQELGDVAPLELLEVHAVNCLAPFLLLRRLEPLLFAGDGEPRHVVNVSAMEGRFSVSSKTGRHPHTNMAKAALNMITRTCAGPYAARGVYVNSADTGWITNEAPQPVSARMDAEGFREPLDAIDGAARVLDPVFVGFSTGGHEYGKFWKDYHPISW